MKDLLMAIFISGDHFFQSIFLTMWFIFDVELIIIFPIRKKVKENRETIIQRSIAHENELNISSFKLIKKLIIIIWVYIFIYCVISYLSSQLIQGFLEWYKGIFIVSLLSLFFSWIAEKKYNDKPILSLCFFGSAIILSIFEYIFDIEDIEIVNKYRTLFIILFSVFFTLLGAILLEIPKYYEKYLLKKLRKKGIRKDLFYRTTRLEMELSNIELCRICERYFKEYSKRYYKIEEIHTLEYVMLSSDKKNNCRIWYKKTASIMFILWVVSAFTTIMSMVFGVTYKHFVMIGLNLVYIALIKLYKYKDFECLYLLGIRLFYNDLGYYLVCKDRNKFVGTTQIFPFSKYHKYIYSFLDIVALCRAAVYNDKMNEEKKICIITENLCDLFENYTEFQKKPNWIMVIPLWAAAVFEFYVTNEINQNAKRILLMAVDDNTKHNVTMFLQSFWVDMERKKIDNGVSQFIQEFEKKLFN